MLMISNIYNFPMLLISNILCKQLKTLWKLKGYHPQIKSSFLIFLYQPESGCMISKQIQANSVGRDQGTVELKVTPISIICYVILVKLPPTQNWSLTFLKNFQLQLTFNSILC